MTAADLQSWQDRRGLSQVAAAGRLCVPVQTYRNWIRGRTPVPEPISELCRMIERYEPVQQAA